MMKAWPAGLLLCGLVALPGCGSSNNGPTQPTTPTPPPTITETIVLLGDSGSFPAEAIGYIEFSIPTAGTVNATIDWTFASSLVAIALTTNACNDFEAAFLSTCSHIGTPNLTSQKPKTITAQAQPGIARLWVLNASEVDESVAVQITLTRTRTASDGFAAARTSYARWTHVSAPAAAEAVRRLNR